MNSAGLQQQDFFNFLKYGPKGYEPTKKPKWDNVAIAGFDSETEVDKGNHHKNHVISYQLAVTSETASGNAIQYTRNGERLRFADIVELAFKVVNGGQIPKQFKRSRNLLVVVAHFSVADWANLADRDQPHIRRKLRKVRKSPVTGTRTIKVTIGRQCTVHVMLFDTILLAPMGQQSLMALSKLTGVDPGTEKISIPAHYKSRMRDFLRDHPADFERYAIQDAVVARDAFLTLQYHLNQIAFGKFQKMFLTLAAAGVAGFMNKNPWYKDYTKALNANFTTEYALIREGFLGGRNESFFLGNTAHYLETIDKIFADIDFCSYYASILVAMAKIDVNAAADLIPLRYACDDKTAAKLAHAKVPLDIIDAVRAALEESEDAFDHVLRKGRRFARVAERVREICAVVDRRLIDKWKRTWEDAISSGDPDLLYCIPGFALVRVRFPEKTLYPCIPVKHEDFGLGYFLESKSVVTAIEIVLAMEAGAVIEPLASVELPIELDASGKPLFVYREYLRSLIQERTRFKQMKNDPSAKIKEQLLKELANSAYGKLGQGIGHRTGYQPSSGRVLPVLPSPFTEACAAGLVTGLGRAALSSFLIAVERYNSGRNDPREEITPVSCTTDGLLVGLPMPSGYSVLEDYYKLDEHNVKRFTGVTVQELLEKCGCEQFMELLDVFTPFKLLRTARVAITGADDLFEIKHLVDSVESVKTRGQIGYTANGDVHVLARFGHRVPDEELVTSPGEPEPEGMSRAVLESKWLSRHIQEAASGTEHIQKYITRRLAGLREILESNGELDCVMLPSLKKINTDYDYKRKVVGLRAGPLSADSLISPFTKPHRSLGEMLIFKRIMFKIRESGFPATPRKVINQAAYQNRTIRFSGGTTTTTIRQFFRGIVQGHIPLSEDLPQQADLAERVNKMISFYGYQSKIWTANDIKKAREGNWCPGSIPSEPLFEKLVGRLCGLVGADKEIAQRELLAPDVYEAVNTTILEQVIKSLLHGYTLKLKPFIEVYQRGFIPSPSRLMEVFPQLAEKDLERCINQGFQPGTLPRYCHGRLVQVFQLLGIPRTKAVECADVIAPPLPKEARAFKNRIEEKCLRSLVQALFQPDVTTLDLNPALVVKKLQRFGLTRRQYYSYISSKFVARTVKDTPTNRGYIRKVTAALNIDASPYLAALLDQ